ncbi:capsular biosynthesis protein [candidate division KSB1 bacterium]|nr:capsular biosynthesis protein [candidate division KSB1 bacterium]RQW05142.1 MAG: capsular biosynthesis protein [candidate division KSB1 bacterium]
MPFIDTHNHIIPYVDDGAEDWDMALSMLRDAEADGIVQVVATPHVLSDSDLNEEKKYITRFDELKKRAEDAGIQVKLHLGSELYIQPYYDFKRRMATLAQNGRYFLIEFPMSMIPGSIEARFFELFPTKYTPIIAHPERNGSIINKPSKVRYFVDNGALLQVTAGSLLGVFGNQVKATAEQLMNTNVVHIIASDAHDLDRRALKLGKAYDYVCKKWGPDRADMLFYANPQKVLNGEDINIGEPFDFIEPQFQHQSSSILNKVRTFFKR